jgi:dipeptidyl aminopeptidase/acylaminoacyl peptidase
LTTIDLAGLARQLVGAWGCWAPSLTADGLQVAYVSDRGGQPELWLQPTNPEQGPPRRLHLSDDPVLGARWSPDGNWLACSVATGGGVRSEVWVVRPDGSDAHRVAGVPEHAILGPWSRSGHHLVITVCGDHNDEDNCSLLFNPVTGARQALVAGPLLEVLDVSDDERFILLRDGSRGAHQCTLFDLDTGREESLLPFPGAGSTEIGVLRPAPLPGRHDLAAYLVTDAGLPRPALVAVPLGSDGQRGEGGILAGRPDAELEFVDADQSGRCVLLVWNVEGFSEVELLDVLSGQRRPLEGLPGTVVAGAVLSRNGSRAVLAVESPEEPRRLWELDVASGSWSPVTEWTYEGPPLVRPTLERLESHDGLEISGWLYQPTADTELSTHPAVVYLHGGPESQERPTFTPQHQLLVAAGIAVFAPNIRGSSGYGRTFVHADDRFGRLDAIDDVASCAAFLIETGVTVPQSIAVAGRSYGGYAVLMALARHPEMFAAGVDVCGMSDLLTFYRDTEPWIARAAVTKYGDPEHDAKLLASVSPMHHLETIQAPLLVIHGALDSNVPLGEAHQLVSALRARGRTVEYLELENEAHEYKHVSSRLRVLEEILGFLEKALPFGG